MNVKAVELFNGKTIVNPDIKEGVCIPWWKLLEWEIPNFEEMDSFVYYQNAYTDIMDENVLKTWVKVDGHEFYRNRECIMKYEPKNERIKAFKEQMSYYENGHVFYVPKYLPGLKAGGTIVFEPNVERVFFKRCYAWERFARGLVPEYGSRLGSVWEYYLFYGVMIKSLYERGWSLEKAWESICLNSAFDDNVAWAIQASDPCHEDCFPTLGTLANGIEVEDFYCAPPFVGLQNSCSSNRCMHSKIIGWCVINKGDYDRHWRYLDDYLSTKFTPSEEAVWKRKCKAVGKRKCKKVK